MSDDTNKKGDAAATASKPGRLGGVVLLVLPAILAGGAAFGGAKIAGAHHAVAAPSEHVEAVKPPGPTLPLDAYLLTVADANKRPHAMKVTMAIEFDQNAKEEAMKALVPRIRDSTLAYLRTTTYEQAIDAASTDKMRGEILEHVRAGGARDAQRILITDFVVQ